MDKCSRISGVDLRTLLMFILCVMLCPGASAQVVRYIHTDGLGSVSVVTDANRNILDRREYEPYGASLGSTVDGVGYAGHVMDAETGLTYMQQRYYDPTIGRFLSVDPVAADGSTGNNFSRYWYANNNPYRFKDPDGRLSCSRSNVSCQELQSELKTPDIPTWQEGSSGNSQSSTQHRRGCDTSECDEVQATRAAILQKQGEALREAGIYGAKEAVWMLPVGRVFGGIGRLLGLAGKEVSFGRNANQLSHTFRHVERAGLNRDSVQRAVQRDLRYSAGRIEAGKPFNQTIDVSGTNVTYTAYKLEDGSINVGRITLPD